MKAFELQSEMVWNRNEWRRRIQMDDHWNILVHVADHNLLRLRLTLLLCFWLWKTTLWYSLWHEKVNPQLWAIWNSRFHFFLKEINYTLHHLQLSIFTAWQLKDSTKADLHATTNFTKPKLSFATTLILTHLCPTWTCLLVWGSLLTIPIVSSLFYSFLPELGKAKRQGPNAKSISKSRCHEDYKSRGLLWS